MSSRSARRPALALALTLAGCEPRAEAPAGAPEEARRPAPADVSPPREGPERAKAEAPETGASAPQGALRVADGQRVLHVWGSAREMGYAHGYLLRDAILAVVDGYALDAIPPATFAAAAPVFEASADIDPALREEAAGVIEGMIAAGGAEVRGLGRALRAGDLLLVNAMTDLVAIGCSSVSAWGPSTAADPRLAGELAIVRNLDWSANPALLESQVVIAFEPRDDPTRQPVVSVAFAGYLGCLSCINEAGVSALFNMGYGEGAASLSEAAAGFAPANLLLRSALERRDIDGDGRSGADDVVHALKRARHAGSYIVHLVEPHRRASAASRPPARVVEVEAAGVAVRTASAGSPLGASALAATNHLRARAAPQSCSRYRRIESTFEARAQTTGVDPLWALGEALRLDEVVHTVLLIPSERSVGVRMRAPGRSMAASPPRVDHRWEALFAEPAPAPAE